MPQPFLPCSFTFWVQGGCSSTCHHTCPPTIRKWEEARVCFWIILFIFLVGLELTEGKGTEVTCICKVENWKVAKVQTLTQPLTSCVSSLWLPENYHRLGDLQQQKLILSWFWRPDGQHQFHGIRAPRQDVGRVEPAGASRGESFLSSWWPLAFRLPAATSLSPLPLSSSLFPCLQVHLHLLQPCSYNDKCAGPYSPPEQSRVLLMNIISKP